ncbi:MAG: glycine zipper 2TM domain-containing protein [Burkholderiales bacterium]|nr:glycine zipper 2TM domain-containing protein [Burkholderiales bacterium]
MNIFKRTLIALCALTALAPFAFFPTVAQAQQYVNPAAVVKIDGFDVEPAPRLSAGNELLFTLYGNPGGTASVRIEAVVDRFPLAEVEAGVYEATYTISIRDRITATSTVTANLRVGNQIATAILDESLLAGAASRSDMKRASDAAAAAAIVKVTRFEVDPPVRLDAGEQLFFSLSGNPGGKASVRIKGVKGKLALTEVAAGRYEGLYTIKNRDRIAANAEVIATLRVGERESRVLLGQSLLAAPGHTPSSRRAARYCTNCGVVESINVVEVKGEGTYLGKIAGGVVGALIGSQIGKGRGTTAAEIAGAVGGAVAGNEIEKRTKKTTHYEVTVRFQGGGAQTISYAAEPAFRVGDKVKVENGALVAN